MGYRAFFEHALEIITLVTVPDYLFKQRIISTALCHLLEIRCFTADFALIKCSRADRLGNLVYSKTARNFSPVMAMAAKTTIVQADSIVAVGDIDPEVIVTPGVFVDRVVAISDAQQESALLAAGASYP